MRNIKAMIPSFVKGYAKKFLLRRRGILSQDYRSISMDIVNESPIALGSVRVGKNVRIGKRTYMNSGYLHSNITIGRFCSIGYNVLVAPPNHPTNWLSTHPFQYNEDYGFSDQPRVFYDNDTTVIGNDVWIGANVIILRGVKICDGAVIAAGAVVTKDVEPYAIVGGIPAKVLKHRFPQQVIDRLVSLKWWDKDEESLKSLPYDEPQRAIDLLESKIMIKNEE